MTRLQHFSLTTCQHDPLQRAMQTCQRDNTWQHLTMSKSEVRIRELAQLTPEPPKAEPPEMVPEAFRLKTFKLRPSTNHGCLSRIWVRSTCSRFLISCSLGSLLTLNCPSCSLTPQTTMGSVDQVWGPLLFSFTDGLPHVVDPLRQCFWLHGGTVPTFAGSYVVPPSTGPRTASSSAPASWYKPGVGEWVSKSWKWVVSLTHSLTHSLPRSLTHSLTHSVHSSYRILWLTDIPGITSNFGTRW